jgi:Spermine/spermidine synthase domain
MVGGRPPRYRTTMVVMSVRRSGARVIRQRVDTGVAELVGDRDRPRAWTLLVDGTPQSYVDLDDPQYLEFEYMRRLGHLVDLAAPAGEPLQVLHLGGGGLTLARYVAATRPGSGQLAVESDAELVELVRRQLPLSQRGRRAGGARAGGASAGGASAGGISAGRVRVRTGDARAVLEQVPAGSFAVVVADLFTGARTPAHLTSAEFAAAVDRALMASGIYAVNIGDGPPLAYARAQAATVRSVFPCACLIADAGVLRGRRFGNLVLAAAHRQLPVAGLARRAAADPFPGRLVHGADLDRFAAGARPVTDARAESSPAPPPGTFDIKRKPGRLALCRSRPDQNINRAETGTPVRLACRPSTKLAMAGSASVPLTTMATQ